MADYVNETPFRIAARFAAFYGALFLVLGVTAFIWKMLSHITLWILRVGRSSELMQVYNLLPAEIVELSLSVSEFQGRLQELLLERAIGGCDGWADTFSPRLPRYSHLLR